MILGLLLAFPTALTFEVRAEPMTTVVARLAEATKTPLLCAPDVGRRRVIAAITNAEPEEIRTRLADAVGAEWVETPKGLRLEITPRRRSASLARHQQLRREWADRALAQVGAFTGGPWTAEEVKRSLQAPATGFEAMSYTSTPATRAVSRILRSIGPNELADIEWGETRYFSTLPGGRYLTSLSAPARQAVKTFNTEVDVLQQVVLENPDLAQGARVASPVTSGQKVEDRVRAQVSDITFSVTRGPYGEGQSVVVFMSSPAGTMPNGAHLSLNPDPPQRTKGPVWDLIRELSAIPVKPSDEVEQYLAYRTAKAKPPADAPATFRHPERFEPLEMIYGEAARALAQKKGWNVVLQVGDLDYLGNSSSRDASPLSELFAPDGRNVTMDSKWLVVGAKDQVETDKANLDRTVFGAYSRALTAQGYGSAASYLPVVRATGGLEGHPLVRMVHQALRLERLSSEGIPTAPKLLLFDALPARSFRGRFGDLSPTQRAALETHIFRREGIRFFDVKPAEGVNPMDQLGSLPNVSFPNGLPNDLLVDLRIDDEEAAFQAPTPDKGITDHMPWSASSLARWSGPEASAPPRFRMGRQIRYLLKVEAPVNRLFSDGLSLLAADLSKPALEFSQLPESFRRQVDAKKNGRD